MRNIKWKILIVTCFICLLPSFGGLALWDSLPDSMAIHFDFRGEPDNFASKAFVVFGLPLMMMAAQIICCISSDIKVHKNSDIIKFEKIIKWIIPAMTVFLQIITLGYSLGWNMDIRKVVAVLVGLLFILIGACMTKSEYIKNFKADIEKIRKINRFSGKLMIVWGFLMLITIFLPPLSTLIWIFSLIPYTVICLIYRIKTVKKK